MAIMTLPLHQSTPSSPVDDSESTNNKPQDPVSPTIPTPSSPVISNTAANPKRKPSRRANTAERRATHNAVERQRRETLNGRFLDLAALLPNLSQIRRPSKSSIVNSSIAHIHASRRHRMLASRELRLLKLEADALRRELNEWRERAGIPRIEDPVRGDGFSMIIGGELEVIVGVAGEEDDEDDEGGMARTVGYGGYVGGDGVLPEDEFDMDVLDSNPSASPVVPHGSAGGPGSMDDPRMLAILKAQNQSPFAHSLPPSSAAGVGPAHILPRPGSGPTNIPAFDAMYEYPPQGIPHHGGGGHHAQQAAAHVHMLQQQHAYHAHVLRERERERERDLHFRERDRELAHLSREREIRERERALVQQQQAHQEKLWSLYNTSSSPTTTSGPRGSFQGPQWNPQQQQMMMQAQRSLFTPPATSHGLPTPSPTASSAPVPNPVVGSPASSASGDEQGPGLRARSGSVASGGRRGSSRGSSSPSYELGVGLGDYGVGMGVGGMEYAGHTRMGGMMGMGMEVPMIRHGHGQVGVEIN